MAQGCRVRWEFAETGSNGFSIHRLMEFKNGAWSPGSKWVELPDSVALSTNLSRSSLMGTNTLLTNASFSRRGTNFSNRRMIGVTFLPDGTTLLPSASSSFLTPLRGLEAFKGLEPPILRHRLQKVGTTAKRKKGSVVNS